MIGSSPVQIVRILMICLQIQETTQVTREKPIVTQIEEEIKDLKEEELKST